ncbi:short-chain dehydrogenase reductase 3b-like [Ipomoea triloba]|uniref:short-chain dehydrogenase reductase 3b-like n=1 Tax=Ipomoea triloba TaxID=35885 RepID=UPI00125DBB46|nr:short-chain dehydrogenase reductase 3b-like [Ipomoea triloba]
MSTTTTTTSRRLEGKVALITGAASGIGEEAVRVFAEQGAFVVAADVQDELGHRLVQSINNNKTQASVCYHHCDVRDEKQVEDTVSYAVSRYGRLDILFSNAAIMGPMAGIMELDLQALDDTLATNVRGVAATIKHAARAMVAGRTRGSVICTSSVAGCLGGSGPHAYTASKHAIVGLVRSVCSELGAHGIRVNSIAPFGVATPLACKAYGLEPSEVEANTSAMANLKGIVLKPAHVAKVALFLASDDSAYISGQNLAVDGGYTVVTHTPAHLIPSHPPIYID